MRKNIGRLDKIIRFVVGAILIWAAYTQQVITLWYYVLYGLAVFSVITAFIGTCPTWLVLGMNTLRSKKK